MEHQIRRQSSQTFGYSGISSRPATGYAYSVSGGAGGRGTKISTASYSTRLGSGFGGGYDFQSSEATSGKLAIGNEKIAMQSLNDRLASYLEKVRNLEQANKTLEIKIREVIEKKGPLEGRDYSKYYAIIAELRAKVRKKCKLTIMITCGLFTLLLHIILHSFIILNELLQSVLQGLVSG